MRYARCCWPFQDRKQPGKLARGSAMPRQAASLQVGKHLILVFLVLLAALALLGMGLSFIYQPLFARLFNVPSVTALALFALLMTLLIRQSCVEHVPSNTIGVVSYSD